MKTQKALLISFVALMLVLSACVPAQPEGAVMENPTQAMMDTPAAGAMTNNPTAAMMNTPTTAMMDSTSTPGEMMQETSTPDAMMAKPTEGAMMDSTAAPGQMMQETTTPDAMMAKPTEGAMMETPVWFGAALTNVSTGKSFTIADFKGKVVLVETMAQWCPTCKDQQMQVKSLLEKLGMPADLVTLGLDIDPNENGDMLKTYAAQNGYNWMFAVSPANVSREIGNLYGSQFLNPPSTPILIVDRTGKSHPLPFGVKSADELMKAVEPYLNGM